MNRATRICINFWPSSNYLVTRARGKRGTKKSELEEVLICTDRKKVAMRVRSKQLLKLRWNNCKYEFRWICVTVLRVNFSHEESHLRLGRRSRVHVRDRPDRRRGWKWCAAAPTAAQPTRPAEEGRVSARLPEGQVVLGGWWRRHRDQADRLWAWRSGRGLEKEAEAENNYLL